MKKGMQPTLPAKKRTSDEKVRRKKRGYHEKTERGMVKEKLLGQQQQRRRRRYSLEVKRGKGVGKRQGWVHVSVFEPSAAPLQKTKILLCSR